MILSMDALFGLPRKLSAGYSHREALHGSLYFLDQTSVDEFVHWRRCHRLGEHAIFLYINRCMNQLLLLLSHS